MLLSFKHLLKKINKLSFKMRRLSDRQLKDLTSVFRGKLQRGASLDDILVEAYAAIREADRRVLGMFPYDVQVLGAIALHKGYIAEMKTGEGKTLTATMPLYLHGLLSRGTFLVAPNSYLAQRDKEKMGKVYQWMGLTVGLRIPEKLSSNLNVYQKKKVYQSDIIYTINSSLGFDYLIDNLASSLNDKFMCPFDFVIVDEADEVLLDSATSPLVISGSPRVKSNYIGVSDEFVRLLNEPEDYTYNEDHRRVSLTRIGVDRMEKFFGVKHIYSNSKRVEILRCVLLSLRAHKLYVKDEDYVLDGNDEVILLNSSNGRLMQGMKMQAGQHQAIEMKEQVHISEDLKAIATVTYQNLFKKFNTLSGMSGTAVVAKREFMDTYFKSVITIPTNKRVVRKDMADQPYVFMTDKIRAVVRYLKEIHSTNRPILLVTSSIEMSEIYSKILLRDSIPHSVLNARNAVQEAGIIANAGRAGSITIATNMAGRGTDIRLDEVAREAGGLAVIGTEKMISKRIEEQLRGRAGRQGDPGSSIFFTSLEDKVVLDNSDRVQHLSESTNRIVWRPLVRHYIGRAQAVADELNFQKRKQSFQMDISVHIQRELVYAKRNMILNQGVNLDKIYDIARSSFSHFLKSNTTYTDRERLDRYILDHIDYNFKGIPEKVVLEYSTLVDYFTSLFQIRLNQKLNYLVSDTDRIAFLKLAVLKAIDTHWVEEVDNLEQLKQIVASRTAAQKNIYYEYHREAFISFNSMIENIQDSIVKNLSFSTIVQDKNGNKNIYFM
ncbi:accessory Sec system translocase SecA2 [Lactiplantibacillus plantarum]|uniref:accessory Sec system translocase SecA2 n=1 Tax=Lactiplantibacillus plantarum TaxID=1590 RepID=UPI002002A7C9|nr:accessory Sec system translocase SecA2 [Lactiplantibacillus plantarum]MCK6240589.1 accessory Sec system translocase SecA2 [Lactiplantibacillus plantarum]